MNRRHFHVSAIELVVAIVLVGIVAAMFLPALARSRESARRSSCANNLKQLGLAAKMFANEHPQGALPPLSPIPYNWTMDMHAVYPEYLSDANVLICPSSPRVRTGVFYLKRNDEHPGQATGVVHADCISSMYYIYTGYRITSDEQAAAFRRVYDQEGPAAFQEDLLLDVPVWNDSDRPSEQEVKPNGIPVMWDSVPLNPDDDWNHVPSGGNVLFLDGHCEFRKYSYYNNSSQFPITRMSAEAFGSTVPQLSSDCYSP